MFQFKYDQFLKKADALLIVPPLGDIQRPNLSVHVLQSYVKKFGFKVQIFYANIAAAKELGLNAYEKVSQGNHEYFWGERLFSSAAYNTESFGISNDNRKIKDFINKNYVNIITSNRKFPLNNVLNFERKLDDWSEGMIKELISFNYNVVGVTNTFEQTAAGILFLNTLKKINPSTTTIMGGANCENVMAEGIASLSSSVDYIFSGEGEIAFYEFLRDIKNNRLPENKIINCEKKVDLDEIGHLDYSDYYNQIEFFFPKKSKQLIKQLSYETSRGCIWNEKGNGCNFCALSTTDKQRNKSPEIVLDELKRLTKNMPGKIIHMTDIDLPSEYFKTLLPRMKKEIPGINFIYQIRPTVTYDQVKILKSSGAWYLGVGIEAMSNSLLKRMNKGTRAHHNIRFLRYCRIFNIYAGWFLLYAFPYDTKEEYEETLKIIELIPHLFPPMTTFHLSLQKFCNYVLYPDKFGVKNIKPLDSYYAFLPKNSLIEKLAYYFTGNYECFAESNEGTQLMQSIFKKIKNRQNSWHMKPKSLQIIKNKKNQFILIDTRNILNTKKKQLISEEMAIFLLSDILDKREIVDIEEKREWALKNKLMLLLNSHYVSLVTSSETLINDL
jgi:ribosomal peptide maturation radical SAM protein 1